MFVQSIKRSRVAADDPSVLRALQVIATVVELDKRRGSTRFAPYSIDLPGAVESRLVKDEVEMARQWWRRWATVSRSLVTNPVLDEIGKVLADIELRRLTAVPIVAHRATPPPPSPSDP